MSRLVTMAREIPSQKTPTDSLPSPETPASSARTAAIMAESRISSGVMLGIMPKEVRAARPHQDALRRLAFRATAGRGRCCYRAIRGDDADEISPLRPLLDTSGRDMDIAGPIRAYIEERFSPQEAKDAEEDLETLSLLRSEVVSASGSQTPEQRRETLLAYYRALSVVEGRFPVSKQGGHVNLPFTWTDRSTRGNVDDARQRSL